MHGPGLVQSRLEIPRIREVPAAVRAPVGSHIKLGAEERHGCEKEGEEGHNQGEEAMRGLDHEKTLRSGFY
jgi:hypothetical protein